MFQQIHARVCPPNLRLLGELLSESLQLMQKVQKKSACASLRRSGGAVVSQDQPTSQITAPPSTTGSSVSVHTLGIVASEILLPVCWRPSAE